MILSSPNLFINSVFENILLITHLNSLKWFSRPVQDTVLHRLNDWCVLAFQISVIFTVGKLPECHIQKKHIMNEDDNII